MSGVPEGGGPALSGVPVGVGTGMLGIGTYRSDPPEEELSPIEATILASMTAITYVFCPTCGDEAEPWFLSCGECGTSLIKSVHLREQVTSGALSEGPPSAEESAEVSEAVSFACMKCGTTERIEAKSSITKCEQFASFHEFVDCPFCGTAQACP